MTTLLIAAGDPVTALGLDMILSEAGYRSVCATADDDILGLVDRLAPDGILLDAALWGRDGFAALDRLRRARRLPALPLVMMVGRSGPVEREKARALGAAAVLTKPFARQSLLDALADILPLATPRRSAEAVRATGSHG